MKALIIEDDPQVVESVSIAFQMRWPQAELLSSHLGSKALDILESESPDIVILDIGLPDGNGFDLLKQIRLFSSVPVIILTVQSDEADIVKGLELGADDYLVKPFRHMELLARIWALLRRQAHEGEELPVTCGSLCLDSLKGELSCEEKRVNLTTTEARIMRRLMENAGHVVAHSSLAEAIWGEGDAGADDSIKVHIRRLRQKIEVDPSNPQLILTVPGAGYSLAKPATAQPQ